MGIDYWIGSQTKYSTDSYVTQPEWKYLISRYFLNEYNQLDLDIEY